MFTQTAGNEDLFSTHFTLSTYTYAWDLSAVALSTTIIPLSTYQSGLHLDETCAG